jgi:hypothetical protein
VFTLIQLYFFCLHVSQVIKSFLCLQAAVLLLFNAEDRLSYNDIKNQLNLTDEDIVRLLHSLSCAKYKILSKDPNSKSVEQSDTFEFNTKFTDKMRRIKVQIVAPVVNIALSGLRHMSKVFSCRPCY